MKTVRMSETRAARAQVRFWTAKRREARRIEVGAYGRYLAVCEARRAARTPENDERWWDASRAHEVAMDIRQLRQRFEWEARERLARSFA